ncbi:DoxX family protein [Allostreptomyces psammosilenae]|uniref:DoxX family protein n=1 Tax=Allostreptomyces psammosilenae TaxID=1892865 RepID=A0A852ZTR1_9ACTN|nr:DoxX family protein [Allostreptomyces psammosilenae]NYI04670.1 hypothetical protein [Allostreptomyces psammosilenae]
MFTAYAVTTVIAIAATAWSALVDLTRARFVLANAEEVGVPRSWLPWLAAVKGAGAAGLLLGLLGARSLGVAAAAGLVLFFVGAVAAHVRRSVYHNIGFAAGYLGLAVLALVLAVAR